MSLSQWFTVLICLAAYNILCTDNKHMFIILLRGALLWSNSPLVIITQNKAKQMHSPLQFMTVENNSEHKLLFEDPILPCSYATRDLLSMQPTASSLMRG